jgi:hypothetical protein
MVRSRGAVTGVMVTWALAAGLVCGAHAKEAPKPFEHFVTAQVYAGEGREDDRYLKIVFRTPAQLSRVEIGHAPRDAGDASGGTKSRTE